MKRWLPFLICLSSIAQAVDFKQSLQETAAGKALAKNSGHAYCEMRLGSSSTINGYQTQELVPLASVSKVITSYWALATLGADYRYETKLHLSAVNDDTYDLHIEGSLDPVFGRQMVYFMMSELNRMQVRKIRKLSFDENFRLFMSVREIPHTEIAVNGPISSQETGENLSAVFQSSRWSAAARDIYSQLVITAKNQNITLLPQLKLSLQESAQLVRKSDFSEPEDTVTISLKSAPLTRYLKDMNIYSNNYIADVLWYQLGGEKAFHKFYADRLSLGKEQIQFFTGSGLPRNVNGQRKDNLATCQTVLQILNAFESDLQAAGMSSTDVMMVGGVDGGTLGSAYQQEAVRGAVVAKTGTINQTKTLAGYVSTQEGKYFFGTFFRVSGSGQAALATVHRDYVVRKLIGEHGGRKEVGARSREFLPFDKASYFKTITAAIPQAPKG